jgi:hypothetical protein
MSMANECADPIAAFAEKLLVYLEGVAKKHATSVFTFGPLVVEMKVVGDFFRRRLTQAIEFALSPADLAMRPAWRIIAVDGAQSDAGAPPGWTFPVTSTRHLERLHHCADRQLTVRYNPATSTWNAVCGTRRLAVVWTADAARLPDWDDAAPCRDLLHWMTLSTGYFLAHAAAIGVRGKGVLLTGPGGSGKSTTAAAAAMNGLMTAGDDFVLVDPQAVQAHALYDTIKLDARSAQWFPDLAASAVNQKRDPAAKARIHLSQRRPASFAHRLPINAILLPHAGGATRTSIKAATGAEAMRALVPSTICLLRGGEAETVRKSTSFLRELPSFHCDLGADPHEAIAAISAFIADLST